MRHAGKILVLLCLAVPATASELRLDAPTPATSPADPQLQLQADGQLAAWFTAEVAGEREHFAVVSADAGASWPAPEMTGVMASWRNLLAQPYHMYPYGFSVQANPNGTVALLAKAERLAQGEIETLLYSSFFDQQGRQLVAGDIVAWGPYLLTRDIGPDLYLGGPSADPSVASVLMGVNGWPGDNYPLPGTTTTDQGATWAEQLTWGPGDHDIAARLHVREGDRAISLVQLRDADTHFYQYVAARTSSDGGATWNPWTILETEPAPNAWGDAPVLLAAATPVEGLWWARYDRAGQTVNCWSTDDGATWNTPTVIKPTDASGRAHHYDPADLDHHWGVGTLHAAEHGYLVEWEDDGLFPIGYRWSTNYGLTWRPWEQLPTSSAPGEAYDAADFGLAAPGVFAAVYTKASGGAWFSRMATATAAPVPSTTLQLGPARPNPARGSIELRFAAAPGHGLRARVLDLRGRVVAELPLVPGSTSLHWDGRDQQGRRVAAGSYRVQLQAGGQRATSTVTLLRP